MVVQGSWYLDNICYDSRGNRWADICVKKKTNKTDGKKIGFNEEAQEQRCAQTSKYLHFKDKGSLMLLTRSRPKQTMSNNMDR